MTCSGARNPFKQSSKPCSTSLNSNSMSMLGLNCLFTRDAIACSPGTLLAVWNKNMQCVSLPRPCCCKSGGLKAWVLAAVRVVLKIGVLPL